MTFSQITYFQAVCRYQNVTQAANALFVSQPTISVAIRDLEQEFNVRLFFRKGKQLILTKEGTYFLSQINELLSLYNQIEANMKELSSSHPTLRLGLTPILSIYFFNNFFHPFQESHSNVQLEISEYSIENIFQHLKDSTLDMVMTFLDNQSDDEIQVLPLLKTKLCFCVSKSHPFAGLDSITFPKIKNEPLALIRSSYHVSQKINPLFEANDTKPNIVLSANQYHIIRSYIIQNYAGGFFPKAIIAKDPEISCIPIEPNIDFVIGLAWNKNQKNIGNTANLFVNFIKNKISSEEIHNFF
ncbi:MAG: LysR substrate-binding domain-containing protein [Clostridiaceae bacterium]